MAAAVAAVSATTISFHRASSRRLALWEAPMHSLAVAAVSSTVALAGALLAVDRAALVTAAVAFGTGCYASITDLRAPEGWRLSRVGAGAFVVGSWWLADWSRLTATAERPILFGIAAATLAVRRPLPTGRVAVGRRPGLGSRVAGISRRARGRDSRRFADGGQTDR
jgi:hypothetical protein